MSVRRNSIYLLIIISLLVGLFTGRAVFFNFAYLMGILMVLAYLWAWTAVRWVNISRKTRARRAQVGRYLDEAFTVQNVAWIPKLWMEVRDYSELPGHRASNVVPALLPRGRFRWYVHTPCLTRGEFRLGALTLSAGDPFGLFMLQRRLDATSKVTVLPLTVDLLTFHLPVGLLSGGLAQRQRTHNITTNAVGVREYVSGDSINRVHWRSTARRDQLMVKEFELDPMMDVWIFVDFSTASLYENESVRRINGTGAVLPQGNAVTIPSSTEEYTVVIAATLAKYFIAEQRALGFAAYTPKRTVYQAERGERQLARIMQTLATARSQSDYTLAQALTLETPHLARGITLIVITSCVDSAWLTEAQILARKGIRPLCIFIDPSSFGSAASSDNVRGMMRLGKIPSVHVRYQDNLVSVLSQRPQ